VPSAGPRACEIKRSRGTRQPKRSLAIDAVAKCRGERATPGSRQKRSEVERLLELLGCSWRVASSFTLRVASANFQKSGCTFTFMTILLSTE
jgi:hypothetical protein